ncbi:MAG: hypothetical protein ACK5KT_11080 [Dysgonomonas sp.]
MNKFICIFFLISSTLVSCSNSENGEDPEPPKPPVNLTEDAIIGTYETYYYQKQIIVKPNTSEQASYGGLRLTDYDGFRTTFYKESGKYKAKDYNLAGNLIQEAEYYISNDTIRFEYHDKTKDGRDTIIKTYQHIREFGRTEGIIKLDRSYYGKTIYDGVEYRVIDAKATRNVATAPNSTQDVIPAKVMIDYNDMMNGTWHIYAFKLYVDGVLNKRESDLVTDTLSRTSYKFALDQDGDKICHLTEWDYGNNKWETKTFPVLLIDDVIHLLYQEPVKNDEGETVYEDRSIFMWVTSWKKREGYDSFIDLKEQRYTNDVKVIIKTEIYVRREPDV